MLDDPNRDYDLCVECGKPKPEDAEDESGFCSDECWREYGEREMRNELAADQGQIESMKVLDEWHRLGVW